MHRRVGRLHRAWLGSDSCGVVEFLKLSREAVGLHGGGGIVVGVLAAGGGGGGHQGVELGLLGVDGGVVDVQVREGFEFGDIEDTDFVFRANVEKVFCEGFSFMEVAM